MANKDVRSCNIEIDVVPSNYSPQYQVSIYICGSTRVIRTIKITFRNGNDAHLTQVLNSSPHVCCESIDELIARNMNYIKQ